MTNPIKIYSVVSKGCIFFDGSTVTPKFLGTIECEAHPTLTDRVIIYRTDRVSRVDSNSFRKLFRKLNIARIQNVVGEYLVEDLGYDRDQVVAYINSEANTVDVPTSGQSFAPGTTANFYRDETSTTVLFSNGDHHGVNSIKAVVKENGRVGILTINADVELYEYDYDDIQIGGSSAGGNVQTVVNNLNALFTVSAVPAPIPSPTYDLADIESLVWNARETFDPAGDALYGATSSSYHGARVWTTETISQPGEYFTFMARNVVAGGGALMGIGLYDANGDDLTEILDDNLSNSGHHGYWFSNWFYNYSGYTAPWTTYGSNSGLVYGPGWNGPTNKQFRYSDIHPEFRSPTGECLFRCGITDEGFVGIWYYDVDRDDGDRTDDWILCARSGTPLPAGDYGLLVKLGNTSCRITSQPGRYALEPAAPTLYYRYIESPDGNFQYPLFASEEEANYVDLQNGGTGTSHAHVYADDVTATTWYMPDTGSTMDGSAEPVEIGVTYTEIPSLTNADQVPPAFSDTTITVNEGESINYQLSPVDVNYVTTIGGIPSWTLAGGTTLLGTAPEVTGFNDVNPSDTTTVTVYRTNSFGTSTGTLTININNLTAPPVSAINGVTLETGSTALVDADTLADGSVVTLDNQINDGSRLVMDKDFVEDYVLPALISGSGNESVWIGFGRETGGSPDWTDGVSAADFELAFEFFMSDADRSGGTWRLKTYKQGTQMNDVGIGSNTSALYNYVFINDAGTIKMGALLPSYGDASSFVWDASAFSWERNSAGLATQSRDIYIGTSGTTFDLPNPFSGFTEVAEPVAPAGNDTNWSKALDFSGSAERAQPVDNSYYRVPLKMAGTNNTVAAPASGQTVASGHPWATAVVFRTDVYNSNQHVWNLGEGSGDSDDNIYLRRATDRKLYFGWGRSGEINECEIRPSGSNSNWDLTPGNWYGIYIAHNGARLGSGHTAAEIAACFDIRLMGSSNSWATTGYSDTNLSTESNWTAGSFGARMNRSMDGYMTIGGRGANRTFRGNVASFVSTTLRCGVAMPGTAEIEEMITDPQGWINDYKVGNQFRLPWQTGNSNGFARNDGSSAYSTQVWLMGDGTNDSYSNMIRNQVQPADQNYTKLNMISMQSNDIQNVTIPGLTD